MFNKKKSELKKIHGTVRGMLDNGAIAADAYKEELREAQLRGFGGDIDDYLVSKNIPNLAIYFNPAVKTGSSIIYCAVIDPASPAQSLLADGDKVACDVEIGAVGQYSFARNIRRLG
jgi:hypothetical protein